MISSLIMKTINKLEYFLAKNIHVNILLYLITFYSLKLLIVFEMFSIVLHTTYFSKLLDKINLKMKHLVNPLIHFIKR